MSDGSFFVFATNGPLIQSDLNRSRYALSVVQRAFSDKRTLLLRHYPFMGCIGLMKGRKMNKSGNTVMFAQSAGIQKYDERSANGRGAVF